MKLPYVVHSFGRPQSLLGQVASQAAHNYSSVCVCSKVSSGLVNGAGRGGMGRNQRRRLSPCVYLIGKFNDNIRLIDQ